MNSIIKKNLVNTERVLNFNFSTMMLFRCIERKYAEDFINGKIYFGKPINWINKEINGNKGKGDKLEGVFLASNENDNSYFITKLKKDKSLTYFNYDGYIYFRKKEIENLNCLCLYGLNDNSFKEKNIDKYGKAHYISRVEKQYFFDFSDNATKEIYDKIENSMKPVVIFISNPHKFFERIITCLKKLEVKEEEIIISPVDYINRHNTFFTAVQYPRELLLKDSFFSKQSEVRVIINSNNRKFIEYMENNNNILDVGNLKDIAEIYDYYFNDLKIERKGKKVIEFNLPHEIVEKYEDMDLERLLNIFIQANVDNFLSIFKDKNKKNDIIKKIKSIIKNKYNIDVEYKNETLNIYNADKSIFEYLNNLSKPYQKIVDFENMINRLIDENQLDKASNEIIKNENDEKILELKKYYNAKISEKRKQYITAIKQFTFCINNEIKLNDSLSSRSICFNRIGEYDFAIKDLERLQEIIGYNPVIYTNKGINLINLGKLNDAINEFNASLNIMKNNPEAYYNRSVAYYRLNMFNNAKNDIENAIKFAPENKYYKDMYNKFYKIV